MNGAAETVDRPDEVNQALLDFLNEPARAIAASRRVPAESSNNASKE